MRASQLRADALDIAVSDAGLSPDASGELEARVCVLLGGWQGYDEEDELLEASDLIEIEAARAGAGLVSLTDVALADDEVDDGSSVLGEGLIDLSMSGELGVVRELEEDFVDTPIDLLGEASESETDSEPETDGESEVQSEPEPEPETHREPETPAPILAEDESPADPIQAPMWSGLNAAAYVFSRGLRGMAQSPLVQLLAIGTMAVCMLLLGTTTLIFANASRVAHDLGVDTPVTVYMAPDVDAATAVELRERIAALPEVARAERVTPEQALARLQAGAGESGERAELLAGIDPGVLPESVEIEFVPGVEPGFADALAARVETMSGVEEVSVLGPWVQEVERMLTTLRGLAIGVGLLVSLACLAIVWSTIRLGVFARRSEIELLRLVGGTARFVRGPFVVEGVVQGMLGTALALTGLWLAFELIRPLLERGMSLLFAAGSLQFFSVVEMAVALGFGALLGLIGSRAAVAGHAEA